MVQTLTAYGIVAAAAGWTAWKFVLRGYFRKRAAASKADCGSDDCACGD
jgi:hypothetical protein